MPTPQQNLWLADALGVRMPADSAAEPAGGEDGPGDAPAQPAAGPRPPLAPQTPVPRADLGKPQEDRAGKLLAAMPAADQEKVKKLLDEAAGDAKKYLTKALSAKHSAAELEAFAGKIAGKSQDWLNDNLHLVGQSSGKGIKQQWHDSCGPTTVQAMMGELDPIYALKLHEDNPTLTEVDAEDGAALNPAMAEQQRAMLEGHGGVAKSRAPDKSTGGEGIRLSGLLNEQTPTIGIKFAIEATAGDGAMDKALSDAETALNSGRPVPARVGSRSEGHFVLITGVDAGPPRRYSIHDPWDGKTLVFTDDQIKSNRIDVAGWTKLTHIYNPSVADGGA